MSAESGPAVRRARPRAGRGPRRCAPPPRSRTRACTRRASTIAQHAPDLAAAARAARAAGHGARRPPTAPAGEGFEVGGDFYDVFSTADDQWYAVIGDVCGKGAEAAAVTALARYTIRAAAVRRRSPAAILRWLSDAMLQQSDGDGRFCTIACAAPRPGALAGARDGRVRRPSAAAACCGPTAASEEVGAPGTLLGLVARARPRRTARPSCARATRCVLYTDGLTEARRAGARAGRRTSWREAGARRGRRARRPPTVDRTAGRGDRLAARGRATTSRCSRCALARARRLKRSAGVDALGCPSPCRRRSRLPGRRACAVPCRSRARGRLVGCVARVCARRGASSG